MARKSAKSEGAAGELAVMAANLAHERNCTDIVVLDLRKTSPVTDYFVICTGTSDRQMRAVAEEIAECGAAAGQRVWRTAGLDVGQWLVMDFVDVVVHLFDETHRKYYDLQLIWGDCPKVQWRSRGRQGQDRHEEEE